MKHKIYESLGSTNHSERGQICHLNFSDPTIICKPSFTTCLTSSLAEPVSGSLWSWRELDGAPPHILLLMETALWVLILFCGLVSTNNKVTDNRTMLSCFIKTLHVLVVSCIAASTERCWAPFHVLNRQHAWTSTDLFVSILWTCPGPPCACPAIFSSLPTLHLVTCFAAGICWYAAAPRTRPLWNTQPNAGTSQLNTRGLTRWETRDTSDFKRN